MSDIVERLWAQANALGEEWPNEAAAEITRLREEVEKLKVALAWYGEQARLARLVHSEGDRGRHALADDGGKRASAALTQETEEKKDG